jgi:hypothetical protein
VRKNKEIYNFSAFGWLISMLCMNIAPLVICSLVGQLQSLLYKAISMGDICKTLVGHFGFNKLNILQENSL